MLTCCEAGRKCPVQLFHSLADSCFPPPVVGLRYVAEIVELGLICHLKGRLACPCLSRFWQVGR